MYTPPQAREGVYFTQNLTPDNYGMGTSVIAEYFRKSPLSQPPYYPITNYDDYINWLETNYPTFIEYLGEQVGQNGTTPMFQVAADVAGNGKTSYARPSDWSNSFIKILGQTPGTLAIIGNGIADAASAVASDVSSIFKIGVPIILIGVGLYVWFVVFQGKLPKPKAFS